MLVKVVDPNGKALPGAKVFRYWVVSDDKDKSIPYICDANGVASLPSRKVFKYAYRGSTVLYGLYEDRLAGFADVNRSDIPHESLMRLWPACLVYGAVKSTELTELGQQVTWTNVYVWRGEDRPLMYSSWKGEYSFLLPDGDYELDPYGQRLEGKNQKLEVRGQRELNIDFDLPADRLAHLVGKEAPPLRKIQGLINSWGRVSLSDLRGKVVLLDFWGTWCGPCVQSVPELMDLHDKYNKRGLVIIGLHDDSHGSLWQLKFKLRKLSKENWGGRSIPYIVALDGGGQCPIEGTDRTARGATTAAYGINSFPTMVLIDRQGKVAGEYHRGYNDDVLERLLAEKPQ